MHSQKRVVIRHLDRKFRLVALASLLAATALGACQGSEDSGGSSGGTSSLGGGAGTGNAGSSSVLPLSLVSTYPAMGSKSASAQEPILLTFSAPLLESSVASAVSLDIAGKSLDAEVTVKGAQLTIIPASFSVPATLSITLSSSLKGAGGEAFVGDSFSISYGVWAPALHKIPEATSRRLVSTKAGVVVAASASGESLTLSTLVAGQWQTTATHSSAAGRVVEVLAAGEDARGVWVATLETAAGTKALFLRRPDGDNFTTVGGAAVRSGSGLLAAAVSSENGSPILTSSLGTSLLVHSLKSDGSGFDGSSSYSAASPPSALAISRSGSGLAYVAFADAATDVSVVHFAPAPSLVGGKLDRNLSDARVDLSLGFDGVSPFVLFRDGDEHSGHYLLKKFDKAWTRVGPAIDVEVEDEVAAGSLVEGPSGNLTVGWFERKRGKAVYYLGEVAGERLELRRVPPVRGVPWGQLHASLTVSADGRALLAWKSSQGEGIELENSRDLTISRSLGAPGVGTCALDEASPPATITATGCYANVAAKKWIDEVLPYSLNSILWSDGAVKRRGILIPKGKTVDFTEKESFFVPVGTIILKEFYLEAVTGDPSSEFLVETRFLVKRCEEGACSYPWSGYSYQWNSAGTEATLMPEGPDETRVDFNVTDGGLAAKRTHIYPGRTACLTCHNEAAGRVLGISAPQLERSFDDGVWVDNLLHDWAARGIFGESVTTATPSHPEFDTVRLPSPPDVSYSLAERTRGYFQSNCAHCHRPGGLMPSLDFRYFGAGPVSGGNICSLLVPGDHTTPVTGTASGGIYERDSSRSSNKMPPIATDVADQRQLKVTAAWIDSLVSCPD